MNAKPSQMPRPSAHASAASVSGVCVERAIRPGRRHADPLSTRCVPRTMPARMLRLSANGACSFPAPSNASVSPSDTNIGREQQRPLAGDDLSVSATDAIIEELKALAKSMLDATNAARKRGKLIESYSWHEAVSKSAAAHGSVGGRRRAGNFIARATREDEVGASSNKRKCESSSNSNSRTTANHIGDTEVCTKGAHLHTDSAGTEFITDIITEGPSASPHGEPASSVAAASGAHSNANDAAGVVWMSRPKSSVAGRSATRSQRTDSQNAARARSDSVSRAFCTGPESSMGRDVVTPSRAACDAQPNDDAVPSEYSVDDTHTKHIEDVRRRYHPNCTSDILVGGGDAHTCCSNNDTMQAFSSLPRHEGENESTHIAVNNAVLGRKSSGGSANGDDSNEEDANHNVFDGVRTHVFFRATDQDAYNVIVASAWKPEAIKRRVHDPRRPESSSGHSRHPWKHRSRPKEPSRARHDRSVSSSSTRPVSADDSYHIRAAASSADACSEQDSSMGGENSSHHGTRTDRCGSSRPSRSSHSSGGSTTSKADAKRDSACDEGEVKIATPPTEQAECAGAKSIKVFRVPMYPYGGGITASQVHELQTKFERCIQAHAHQKAGNVTQPALITARAFRSHAYDEVSSATQRAVNSFNPRSPYEFVVEVESSVIFDAARAREERRGAFRRLVKQGSAPATVGTFRLRIIMDPIKTGFEEEKTFPITPGSVVADRYQIIQLIGKATFSRAVRCYDLMQPIYDTESSSVEEGAAETGADGSDVREPIGYVEVCLKIINNSKDFFDQSLDEIRLLTLINQYKDPDEAHVVRLIDSFYYREHTMLVTELLSDNLYEYSRYNREEEDEPYFTLPRLRRIARQITEALSYVHSLNLIHADLKPENILFVSHRRCIVKVIDFGSSCYLSDHLSSYIQSRSYRAPEVVLGCDYDGRIDVWSLGAILAELITGEVLFTSETVCEMLARIVYVCGMPLPRGMLWEGRHTNHFINKFGCIYECAGNVANGCKDNSSSANFKDDEGPCYLYTPVPPQHLHTPAQPSPCTPQHRAGSEPIPGDVNLSNDDRSGHSDDVTTLMDTSPHKLSDPYVYRDDEANQKYYVLKQKLRAAGEEDPLLMSFITACLTLDHKSRPTSHELLSHPFLSETSNIP